MRRVAPLPGNWKRLRLEILERDGHACRLRYAGCLGVATEVDHIVPASRGGSDDPGNLAAACSRCHATKTGREAAARRPRATRKPERHPGLTGG